MSKRLFDLLLGVPAIVLLTPLMGVVALWVKLGSDGPILFRQARVGRHGKPFTILKFRTMVVGAETSGAPITADGDRRITAKGLLLRRYKLDELPQLFNVLKGDMSLVGPRPEVPEFVALYPQSARDVVLSVRPGITGPASLAFHNAGALLAAAEDPHRRYTEDILPRKLDYDLKYVRGHRVGRDIGLLWRTMLVLVDRQSNSHNHHGQGGEHSSLVAGSSRPMSLGAAAGAGGVDGSALRNRELEELLGRVPVQLDGPAVREMIVDKTVLITGAGGSIGSELARQLSRYEPRTLVLYDVSEANIFVVDRELRAEVPGLSLIPVIGDVCDTEHIRSVLEDYDVQILYHAAAYKHVPLMESNVASCVANNTLSTARLAAQAEASGIEHFVFISTDKASRPAGVMGASKRLAERILQERPPSSTRFVIVRFGNVLGSSGSVIPVFRKQIESGGPVTVATPDATRFFMSLQEAVNLVLQASVVAEDRDIMILEMGQSIRIADLARRLIEGSGLKVGEDIEVVYTGLRAGEKEHEDLMTADRGVVRTSHEGLWRLRRVPGMIPELMRLDALERMVRERDETAIREELVRLIPEAAAMAAAGSV